MVLGGELEGKACSVTCGRELGMFKGAQGTRGATHGSSWTCRTWRRLRKLRTEAAGHTGLAAQVWAVRYRAEGTSRGYHSWEVPLLGCLSRGVRLRFSASPENELAPRWCRRPRGERLRRNRNEKRAISFKQLYTSPFFLFQKRRGDLRR